MAAAGPDPDPADVSAPARPMPDGGSTEEPSSGFFADPPDDLTGPFSGYVDKAKSPHGRSRTGVRLIDEDPPSSGRPVPGLRRPLIAVVDTVIGDHAWLTGGTDDPFWRLPDEGEGWRRPELSEPVGPTAQAYGHGTFIAGIIRQLAPEARILSLPVMSDTGHARTCDVLDTLEWLLERVQTARKADPPQVFVDVVNLSFGWYAENGEEFPEARHRAVLDGLAAEGVQVVASAGNRSTESHVYPAAFAGGPGGSPKTQLVSVGALDPDGKHAAYSNFGEWVVLWAPGTGLISTVPSVSGVNWSAPLVDEKGCRYPNPNHLSRGFARWGGTSFAAAWVSARIASHLLDDPHGAKLDNPDLDATHARVAAALAATVAEPDVQQGETSATE